MPKGTDGGQRRTTQAPCGWVRRGSVREVNNLFKIHKRHCDICKNIEGEDTPFSQEAGIMNGWNNVRSGNVKETTYSICVKDGERFDIITDTRTMEQAVNALNEIPEEALEAVKSVAVKNDKKKDKR